MAAGLCTISVRKTTNTKNGEVSGAGGYFAGSFYRLWRNGVHARCRLVPVIIEHSGRIYRLTGYAGLMSEPLEYYTYILATVDTGQSRTYVGWTNDLEKRLKAHNSGNGAKSTKGRRWDFI